MEELEVMKFEESSIRRRGTLEEGVARKPSRIAMEEGANLEHLLRKRRELGQWVWSIGRQDVIFNRTTGW